MKKRSKCTYKGKFIRLYRGKDGAKHVKLTGIKAYFLMEFILRVADEGLDIAKEVLEKENREKETKQ